MAQSARDRLSDGFEGKQRWPELLGVPVVLANKTILEQNPSITDVKVLLNGSPVTRDLRYNRVRLFVNILDYVVQTPYAG
ncbi:unnamed protein product [Withania somnifera]